jgi:hypothetical protein
MSESSTDDSRDGEPQKQVGIAAFGVSKADDPSRYERIMKENAVADALRPASMPTKEELAVQKPPAFLSQHRTARCGM